MDKCNAALYYFNSQSYLLLPFWCFFCHFWLFQRSNHNLGALLSDSCSVTLWLLLSSTLALQNYGFSSSEMLLSLIWLSPSVKCCSFVRVHRARYKSERAWFLVIWPIKSVLHVVAVWRDSHQTSTCRRKEPHHPSQYLLLLGDAVAGTDFTTNFPSLFLCLQPF